MIKFKVDITIKKLPEDEYDYEEILNKIADLLFDYDYEIGIGEPQ